MHRKHTLGAFRTALVLSLGILPAIAVFQTQSWAQTSSKKTVPPSAKSGSDVWISVEGPWAYSVDPRNSRRIVLIAPELDDHSKPSATHAHGYEPLATDVVRDATLDLISQVPSTISCAQTPNCQDMLPFPPVSVDLPNPLLSASVKTNDLKKLLIQGTPGRYVVSLPAPDFYASAMTQESRVSPVWWDDPRAATQRWTSVMTTKMLLHYTVSKLKGFSVNGDDLAFEEGNRISISMNPLGEMTDDCDPGGRNAFRDLTSLFNMTFYVDLKVKTAAGYAYPSDLRVDHPCLLDDPQNPNNNSGFLPTVLSNLESYIKSPSPTLAERARGNLRLLGIAGAFLPAPVRKNFEERRSALWEFVRETASTQTNGPKPADPDKSAKALLILTSIRTTFQVHNRHDGSGACRNPMLHVNPV